MGGSWPYLRCTHEIWFCSSRQLDQSQLRHLALLDCESWIDNFSPSELESQSMDRVEYRRGVMWQDDSSNAKVVWDRYRQVVPDAVRTLRSMHFVLRSLAVIFGINTRAGCGQPSWMEGLHLNIFLPLPLRRSMPCSFSSRKSMQLVTSELLSYFHTQLVDKVHLPGRLLIKQMLYHKMRKLFLLQSLTYC